MDYTGLRKKTIIYFLVTLMMLLIPAAAFAVPQQKTDITKPTRERVKDKDKDKKTSTDKNKKDNKADAGKKDNKAPATAPAGKKETTPADNGKKDAKPAAVLKKDEKPVQAANQPSTLYDNKSGENKTVQDTTNKSANQATTPPRRPPLNTETVKFDAIDVSKHQGTINWEELRKNPKIQLVYIKATEGSDYLDPRYKENIRNARRHGFRVGSYHYLTNRSSATAQFRNFVRNVNREEQDLLPVIDVEECNKWSSQQLRDSLKVFANLLEDYYGCKPVIYTSEKFFIKHLGRSFAGYPLFIAKYNTSQPEIGYKWILWQFSDRGLFKAVKGNRGEVDLSRFNKGCSINDLIYKPAQHKPKASVMDAVDHKEKPATINATEQKPNESAAKAAAKQKTEDRKRAAEKEAKEKEQKKKQAREEAKKAKEKAEAEKKAKEKAEADRKAKQRAEQQKREKERQEAAKKAADEKAKRKAAAQKAREEKAKQDATKTSGKAGKKSVSVKGALTQSQRNDSIRSAKQTGRKINKSSADND